jgi:hypothetical protein
VAPWPVTHLSLPFPSTAELAAFAAKTLHDAHYWLTNKTQALINKASRIPTTMEIT